MKHAVARVMTIAACLAVVVVGMQTSVASADTFVNKLIGPYETERNCQKISAVFNRDEGYPNQYDEYYYCSGKNIWFRDNTSH